MNECIIVVCKSGAKIIYPYSDIEFIDISFKEIKFKTGDRRIDYKELIYADKHGSSLSLDDVLNDL